MYPPNIYGKDKYLYIFGSFNENKILQKINTVGQYYSAIWELPLKIGEED